MAGQALKVLPPAKVLRGRLAKLVGRPQRSGRVFKTSAAAMATLLACFGTVAVLLREAWHADGSRAWLSLPLGRRAALASAASAEALLLAGGLVGAPLEVRAEDAAPVAWVTLPASKTWQVTKTHTRAPIPKTEVIYVASSANAAASATITREPLGSVSKSSTADASRLLELADAFEGTRQMKAKEVADILTMKFPDPFTQRAKRWLDVKKTNDISEFQDETGRRYVRYEYETLDCSSAVRDGISLEDSCAGEVLPLRRHVEIVSVGMEQYMASRPDEPGPVMATLWSLDVAAPAKGAEAHQQDLDSILKSFTVRPTAVMPKAPEEDLIV
eukprot:TRINITY_DN102928_c0_g1_i1.p1 TRINITY_DN102928_c0_g1~~TRINITY_DN102928_c0_g1_i1.p1  ORF type:complete len:330 (-),score=95.29 TRINITY_DN102928_c0_g1_i1:203-1192(-)